MQTFQIQLYTRSGTASMGCSPNKLTNQQSTIAALTRNSTSLEEYGSTDLNINRETNRIFHQFVTRPPSCDSTANGLLKELYFKTSFRARKFKISHVDTFQAKERLYKDVIQTGFNAVI